MQDAVLPAPAGFLLIDPKQAARLRLSVFDEPEEWDAFSQTCSGADGGADWMSSRVVVQGMHCAACSLTLEQALLAVPGVREARVSAAAERAVVVWSPSLTRPSEWMTAPLPLGYRLMPAPDDVSSLQIRKDARLALWRWLVAGFCMMQVMMYAFPAYITQPGDITPDITRLLRWASWVLTLPVILFSCGPFFRNAIRDLRHRSISMDLPVALGVAMTFAISTAATFEPAGWWGREVYFDSLAMFVFFLLTGRWLEQRLRARTSGSLENLMQRLPESVDRLSRNGQFQRVATRRLVEGDLIRVLPGEAFPADGVITCGDTFADEALLTGESRPVPRPMGSSVLAGSHNLASEVQVRIARAGPSTRYAQIVALMQRASVDKPRLAQIADRVARPFLWFVLVAAGSALAFWWSSDPARGVLAAVAVLVVTCPCALSLATPAAMLTSAGWLARQGVLVRRLQALESLAGIDTVVFDKTGTLTDANMGLRNVQTRIGVTATEALRVAASLASHSLHPVSRALVTAFREAQGDSAWLEIPSVREQAGQGVEQTAGQGRTRLGTAAFCGLPQGAAGDAPDAGDDGMTVYLSDAAGWLASFRLEEQVRPDAAQAVAALSALGLSVQMLSGDRTASARQIARRVGIEAMTADCTPQSKLAHVQALQRSGHRVLMAGDGLNDGPVLAAADVSVAIGQSVPLAQAQSDFIMPGAQLMMLPAMVRQARQTLRIVRQNLGWAALYNAVCVPLALTGSLDAWLAGLGMALSSLLVIANASRLSRSAKGI
ncbi:MAG: cation-translocating P-type ATPase [Pseudomonadota bacterium]